MSISDNYVPIKVSGNGVTDEFSGTWQVLVEGYERVYLENKTTGVQVLQVDPTDYSIEFDSTGFTVTFVTPPPSTEWVVVARDVAQDQGVPYKTSRGFQGDVIENSFDKLTAIVQDLQDAVNRSPKVPVGEVTDISLPTPSAGKALIWNSAEDNLENSTTDVNDIDDAVTAAEDAAADAAADAATATAAAGTATTQAGNASASAAAAAASAASVNIPTIVGQALKFLRVNAGATAYEWIAAAALAVVNTFTAAQIGAVVALTSTSNSIAIDLALSNNFSHTTTENTTLANPTNAVAGQSGCIFFTQGATFRTFALDTNWKASNGTAQTLTQVNNAVDTLYYNVRSSTFIEYTIVKAIA